MPGEQLELIAPVKPLLERFGHDFFKRVPHQPGVYIMSGPREQVLYVGQSGDLRARLLQYKNARRGAAPRKLLQLAHAVRSISWEVCETRTDAVLRENQLLRLHQPRFNRMNVYPQAYSFILCSVEPAGFHLAWTHEPGKHSETFGAFKSLRNSFLPLLRTIWRMVRQPKNLAEYPTSLLRGDTCRSFHFNVSASTAFDWILAQVREFLSGKSDRLLTSVQPSDTAETGFEKELQKTDLECLRLFFDKSTRRTALINELAGHGSFGTVIQKEELDDLLALFKSQSQLNIQTSSRQNPVAVVSPICLP